MARRYESGPMESPETTLRAVALPLPPTLQQSVIQLRDPVAFGETLRRRFEGQADSLIGARKEAEGWKDNARLHQQQVEALRQKNRLLAALLLHSFDQHQLSWEPGAIEAALDGVKGRDLMLRRDLASGDLHLRAAPAGDPEPWERL